MNDSPQRTPAHLERMTAKHKAAKDLARPMIARGTDLGRLALLGGAGHGRQRHGAPAQNEERPAPPAIRRPRRWPPALSEQRRP